MRHMLRAHRPAVTAITIVLAGVLASGPAWAQQADPDEDDVPTPPPPPAAAPPSPAPPPYAPAPPPPPPYAAPAGPGVVVVAPGHYGYAPPNPYGVPPHILYLQGAAMRSTGRFLTIGSVVLFAIGVGLLVTYANQCHWDSTTFQERCPDEHRSWLAGGALSIVGSVIGLGVGIPFWAIGSYRMNRAMRLGYVPQYAAAPFAAPTPGGLVAGLRVAHF